MRWLKLFGSLFLLILFLFVGTGLYIKSQYGTLVQKLVVQALNENLKSKVLVGAIETSALSSMPNFTINFQDVLIFESPDYHKKPDTLIYVKRVSLHFNLWDIYLGNYELKEVEISDGRANFEINKKGKPNYFFWKSDTSSADTGQFHFGLNEVSLTNVEYTYVDKSIKLGIKTTATKARVEGDFTQDDLKLLFRGEFDQTSISAMGVDYLVKRNLKINSGIEVDHHSEAIQFLKGEVLFDNSFTLIPWGVVDNKGYRFTASGNGLNMKDLNSLVPKKYSAYKQDYAMNGTVDLNFKIDGSNKGSRPPLIETTFKVVDGNLTHKKSKTKITAINCEGSYSNGKKRNSESSVISVHRLSAQMAGGKISGSGELKDFEKWHLNSSAKGNLNLEQLKEFLNLSGFKQLEGNVNFTLESNLVLSDLLKEKPVISSSSFTGFMSFENLNVLPGYLPIQFSNFSGELAFPKRIVELKGVKGKIQSSQIELNGIAYNFLRWLFTAEKNSRNPLRIEANLKADKLLLEEFIMDGGTQSSSASDTTQSLRYTEIKLNTQIDELVFRDFYARDINSSLYIKENRLQIQPLSANTMDGRIEANMFVQNLTKNRSQIKLQSRFNHVNIEKFFKAFSNFGQGEITDKNLRGITNCTFNIDALADDEIRLIPESVNAKAQVEILNGKLLNYTTLKAVSDYFKSNLVLKTAFKADQLEKNLMNVEFNRLENEIEIRNSEIIIPRMRAGNNIMTLLAEGKHKFSGEIDYRLEFDISELLVKKKSGKNEDAYAENDGGGMRVFLKITGTQENPVVEIDKERRKNYRKAKRNDELNELKSAFHSEFGLFEKDTSHYKNPSIQKEFEIEWEEDVDVTDTTREQKTDSIPKKKKKKKLREMFDFEEEEEFDFGDDDL